MSTPSISRHPADTLLNLIVTLLTPMFIAAADGNLTFARQAAIETINAYRAETQSSLITVAKIIAFGLAALAALSLSMAEDLPIATVLRLHASANASDRSEHRNRAILRQAYASPPPAAPEPDIDEAALMMAAEAMKARTAEHLATFSQTAAREPTTSATTSEESRYQATWAASAAAIAAETAASLPDLSLQERQAAATWIDVLNGCATEFLAGNVASRAGSERATMMPPPPA